MKRTLKILLKNGKYVLPVRFESHISESAVHDVMTCNKFREYLSKVENKQEGVDVKDIEIVGVQMFGKKVGFINMRAMTLNKGFSLPSYVFLRGKSVAILLFINDKIVTVQQYRVPIQQIVLQAPAGMLDESGDFIGTAAHQIEQETSIKIKKQQLIPLGSYYPSVGGSDQEVLMYYCKINKNESQMKEIKLKIHGKPDEKEQIRVVLIDSNNYDAILKTKDSKLISLMFAYRNLKNKEDKII